MWKVIKEGKTVTMFRTAGVTLPCIVYNTGEGKMYGRDNNGKNPSATFSYEGATDLSVKCMLGHISQPHPDKSTVEEFIAACQ